MEVAIGAGDKNGEKEEDAKDKEDEDDDEDDDDGRDEKDEDNGGEIEELIGVVCDPKG